MRARELGRGRDVFVWERVEVARGEMIHGRGEPADALYLVRLGRVELYDDHGHAHANVNGRTETGEEGSRTNAVPRRRVVGPGEFFGAVVLGYTGSTAPTRRPYAARALEDAVLLRLDGRSLLQKLTDGQEEASLRIKCLLGCGDRIVFLC